MRLIGFKNVVIGNLGLLIFFASMVYMHVNPLEMFPGLLTSSVIAVGYLFMNIMMFIGEDAV